MVGHPLTTRGSRYLHRSFAVVGLLALLFLPLLLTAARTAAVAQDTTDPCQSSTPPAGCTDPISQPSRLTQLPDHEVAVISFDRVDGSYSAGIFYPLPDFTLGGQDFSVSDPPEEVDPTSPFENAFDNYAVAAGRFVDPTRDRVVVLTKNQSLLDPLYWILQEINYGQSQRLPDTMFEGDSKPTGTPLPHEWTPGAIAAGDLDKAVDDDGDYRDEVAVVIERPTGTHAPPLTLYVVDYAVSPGAATVNAQVDLPQPLNYVPNAHSGNLYPGSLATATGDFDGDGVNEVAVAYFANNSSGNVIQVVFYRYSSTDRTLTQMGSPVTVASAPYQNPLEIAHGDFDGNGAEDLAVLYLGNPGSDSAQLAVGIVSWSASSQTMLPVLTTVLAPSVDPWNDASDGGRRYDDIRLAAGLFLYDPDNGFPMSRRQLAAAYRSSDGVLTVTLFGFNRQTSWSPNPLTTSTTRFCFDSTENSNHGQRNSFSLVAGNWQGVHASPPSPLWGVAVSYRTEGAATITTLFGQVTNDTTTVSTTVTVTWKEPGYTPQVGGTDCARTNKNALVAFDVDGDSLILGAPVHIVLNNVMKWDYILQEPPKHVDYLPNDKTFAATNGLVNVSGFEAFNVTYGTSSTTTFQTTTTKTSSRSYGASVATTAKDMLFAGEVGIDETSLSFETDTAFNYDYSDNKSHYDGATETYTQSLTTTTANDDAVSYTVQTTDVWRYRVYGTVPDGTTGNAYYEVALPRPASTPVMLGGLGVDIYQPFHENKNLLSYPIVDNGGTFTPLDLGPWCKPVSSPPQTDQKPCPPLTEQSPTAIAPSQQFAYDGTQGMDHLTIDTTSTSGNSRQYTHTFNESEDFKISYKTTEGIKGAGGFTTEFSIDLGFKAGQSFGKQTTSSTSTTETTEIIINRPDAGSEIQTYNYFPVIYITQDGTLKVAHAANTDNSSGVEWWKGTYGLSDPALNLPLKWNLDNSVTTTTTWNIDMTVDAKKMRGFFVRDGQAIDPGTGLGDVLASNPIVGDLVQLEARVYNYSVNMMDCPSSNTARFDLVKVDSMAQDVPPQALLGYATVYRALNSRSDVPSTDTDTDTELCPGDVGIALLTVDTGKSPFSALTSGFQDYRVYVIVNPDPDPPIAETHGWRQPKVTITPGPYAAVNNVYALYVQDFLGYQLETISYTSQGTLADVLKGLTANFNKSQTAATSGISASIGPDKTIILSTSATANPLVPPPTEFRAGIAFDSDGTGYYFVPSASGATGALAPSLSATNDEPGQNNEGWGYLTVAAPTAASAASLEAVSSEADIHLTEDSLSAVDSDRVIRSGHVQAYTNQPLPIRITVHSDRHSRTHEYVELFLGDPRRGGEAIALKQVRGVDATEGGHAWYRWVTPLKPGTYTLFARVLERDSDGQRGNITAELKVTVKHPPTPPPKSAKKP